MGNEVGNTGGARAMQKHETLIREEFSRQADAMSTAALFNDQTILARICEAGQLTPRSRALAM